MIRGIVKQVIEGFIKLFSASGRTDESFDNREYFQHYGYTSRPLPGAEIIIIKEGNHIIAIGSDDRRYRLSIEEGEVALYTDEGDSIHMKRDKTIHIVSGNKLIADIANEVDINTKVAKVVATVSCDVTSPLATVNAATSCIINSPSVLLGGSSGTMRFIVDERLLALFNNHVHTGVQTGGGSSGAPSQGLTQGNVCTSIAKAG
jgi:hypothetical protein